MTPDYVKNRRVGDRSVSPGRTITDTDVVQFSALTGDLNPLHIDAEFAGRSEFGERIAPGMLTLSLGLGLLFHDQLASLPRTRTLTVAGVDRIRFVEPVRLGDTIHIESEVLDTRLMAADRELTQFRFQIENQNSAVVITGRCKLLAHDLADTKDDS